jgi:hypothetical protein
VSAVFLTRYIDPSASLHAERSDKLFNFDIDKFHLGLLQVHGVLPMLSG